MTALAAPQTAEAPAADALVELREDDPAWMDLVLTAPDATVFHLPAWTRVVAGTYGYRAAVLAETDGLGRVAAGVPVVCVRRLAGRAWVSLPFTDRCAPLARDPASLTRLAAGLVEWSAGERAPVEVRGPLPPVAGWRDAVVGVEHVLQLEAGAEALRRGFSETHRRRLRQAERSGLRARLGRTAAEMEAYYRLHLLTRRRQGVPVQPRRFFDALWEKLIASGHGVVVLAETPAGVPVAGAVVLAWQGTAMVKFQASDAGSWALRPNHLCYWTALRWASEAGHRRFGFGRSETRHAGLQRWKRGWGGEAVPLSYASTGGSDPGVGGGALHAALSKFIKHSPTPVCRVVGSLLYRYAA